MRGGQDWWLEMQLRKRVRRADVMVVISGMYVHHRKWIQKEIDMAQAEGIPIVGVRPWGARVTPLPVQLAADQMVGWQTRSIVGAIRAHV